ncbi:MAG TPA: hypothetical protein G4N92_03290 [Anaerolineae bacterium]|nr:hypothetical protein [Anaerolineae bacterium]
MSNSKWYQSQSKEFYIAYSIMINAAQHQGFATYQEIAQAVGLPTAGNYMGGAISELLRTISENEVQHNRPMLSAIVIGVNRRLGEGFISLARKLGLFNNGDDEEIFWKNECKKIYKEWKIEYRISKSK